MKCPKHNIETFNAPCWVCELETAVREQGGAVVPPALPVIDHRQSFIRDLWASITNHNWPTDSPEGDKLKRTYTLHGDRFIFSCRQEGFDTPFIDCGRIL